MSELPAQYVIKTSIKNNALSESDVIEQFRAAIILEDLLPPENIVADGKLRKFSTNGKKSDRAGWYILHIDTIPYGSFGDFRTGIHKTWRADIGRPLTRVEETDYRAKMGAIKRLRETEEIKSKAEARERAGKMWQDSMLCTEHPYLTRKHVKANGARIHRGSLLIPVMAGDGLHSLQLISANGSKRFLSGGRVAGCYYIIGNPGAMPEGGTILCIAEGFATAATIFEATGFPTVVAFHSGNVGTVAKAMRDRFSGFSLILCADDDINTKGNPGLTSATEAALSVGGLLAVPKFGSERPDNVSDFNDMAELLGQESVRKLILNLTASAPIETIAPPISTQTQTAKKIAKSNITDQWTDPLPITTELKPVPDFDKNLLPEAFSNWVMDTAKRQSTAADFVAVTALAAISAVIGRKARVYPKRYDDWLVVPNLWAMLIGRPSSGKTPAMREALKPLRKLADDALEQFKLDFVKYKAALKLQELKVKTAEKNARKALNEGNESQAMQYIVSTINGPISPHQARYIVNDATVEKLGELLNQNPNGLLLERDELYGWLHTLDREDRSNDRTFFLEASSGDGAYTYDRIGRGTLHIPALCLSIVGGIQPARLAPYIHHAVRGGNGDDGLIQRFQLAVYPNPPTFERTDQSPDIESQNKVYQIFSTLAALKPKTGEFISLRFTNEAQQIFYEWFDNNEQFIRQQTLHPAIESHLIKFRSLIPSLALILELINNPKAKNIGKTATLMACAWGKYLRQHAERIYSSAIDPVPVNALAILGKLGEKKLSNPFMYSDIKRGNWAGLNEKADILSALELLEERGFIRSSVTTSNTGKLATLFHAHPQIYKNTC
jgi:putative DNA primase/helicase